MEMNISFDLIVSIVSKGGCASVVNASKSAGAEGGTIIPGRGTGIRENMKFWGIPIEPEKDIVLTIVPQDRTQKVLAAILEQCKLNQPGAGIAFVLALKTVAGICHICSKSEED